MAKWVVNWAWSLMIVCWKDSCLVGEEWCMLLLSPYVVEEWCVLSLSYVVYRSNFCSVACNHPIDFPQFYILVLPRNPKKTASPDLNPNSANYNLLLALIVLQGQVS